MSQPQHGTPEPSGERSDPSLTVSDDSQTIVEMRGILARLNAGDPAARDEAITIANERLTKLAHRIFRGEFSSLGNAQVTIDVWHESFFKFRKSLEELKPATPREFFGLAARHIRWTLLDMIRKARGRSSGEAASPSVANANRGGGEPPAGRKRRPKMILDGAPGDGVLGQVASDSADGPVNLALLQEFHEAVDQLPDKLKEVFVMQYYGGCTQGEVAETLGVNVRTVKRYWLQARLALVKAMDGEAPEF